VALGNQGDIAGIGLTAEVGCPLASAAVVALAEMPGSPEALGSSCQEGFGFATSATIFGSLPSPCQTAGWTL
jgi:hypothetical protein